MRDSFPTESALAAVVVKWLVTQGWEVYQEVDAGGVCDIVGVRGPVLWAIETKLQFGSAVLEQASNWLGSAHLVSVATPFSRSRRGPLVDWCDWKGVGWLIVTPEVWSGVGRAIEERLQPALRRKIGNRLRKALREEQKTECAAGGAGGGHFTAFRGTCREVAKAVREKPGITIKELVDGITHHYASKSSARSSLVYWIERGKVAGVRVDREGKALRLYPAEAMLTGDTGEGDGKHE